ncbi:MAG: IS110 family transposase [Oscillospiraceae bacterium]|jgi:hypothetical protein|nr:IS110 family transposase [Oscillospiraceae bacterium]
MTRLKNVSGGIELPMLSIPGIGASSTAVILSEYGDFSKFKDSYPVSLNPPATWLSMALLISAAPFSTAAFHLFLTNLFSLNFTPRSGLRERPIRLP